MFTDRRQTDARVTGILLAFDSGELIKDMKHIKRHERNFHFVASVLPQGWDLGVLGGQKIIFYEHGHVAYQIEGDGE